VTVGPRRILMTADTVGGVFGYALELGRVLSEHDIELVLATMGPLPNAEQRERAEAIPGVTLLSRPYRLEWMDDPWSDVSRGARWLLELASSYQPDLVHINGYAHGALSFGVPTVVAAHSCVLSWWRAVKGEAAPKRFMPYRQSVLAGLRNADCVVAPSRAMLAALNLHYGSMSHAQVIYNGCDLSLFTERPKQPCIVAAGRAWDEAKNLSALRRVASSLRWPISIAGDEQAPEGSGPSAVSEYAPRVRSLGLLSRAELAALLGSASIFAAPARYEPFGLSILEAAASGCALVLGDIPSLRELWPDAALFVAPDDHEGLAAALHALTEDALLRRELAARAVQHAAHFSRERFAGHYLHLYQTLRTRERAPTARRTVYAV
jgi:glycogen synthase